MKRRGMDSIKHLIKKIVRRECCDSDTYVAYLRKKGAKIGENTFFWSPEMRPVDEGRANFITIGKNCMITRGGVILAHDYSWTVMRKSHNAFLPDAGGRVTIGDNVFLGMNAIVLKGVTIGSNVIVGAGSVVTHDLPENTVCAGNPCHVICSLDDYCKRKAEGIVDDVYHLYYFLQQTRNRKPTPEDLLYFGYLFTKPESDERRSFAERIRLVADDDKEVRENYLYLKNIFSDFQDFEEYCQRRRKQENGEDEGVLCDT